MRLAIVTGIWQRPEIFRLFAESILHLQEIFAGKMEIIVCVAGSEGVSSQTLVTSYRNFFYVETLNQPLSQKMNAAARIAMRLSPDYCLMLGSDDLVGVTLMEEYLKLMVKKADYAGLIDCFFFDTASKSGLYWAGYTRNFNKGMIVGVGRLISASVLDRIGWVCWPPGYDRVLDTGFDNQMKKIGVEPIKISLRAKNLFCLDIKSSTNMTPFEKWDNSEYVDGKRLLFDNLPEHLATKIYTCHVEDKTIRRSAQPHKPPRFR